MEKGKSSADRAQPILYANVIETMMYRDLAGIDLFICERYLTCMEDGCQERKPHPKQPWCRRTSKCEHVEGSPKVKCILYTAPWKPVVRESGLLEWVCEHGVGHPDDDSAKRMDDRAKFLHGKDAGGYGIHGCDGCCGNRDFPGIGVKRREKIRKEVEDGKK